MINNSKERRIKFDEDSWKILNNLTSNDFFSDLSLAEMFALCLIYGKKQKMRTPLDKDKKGRIREATINNTNIVYLMMAIAVEETDNMEIILDKNEYFKISEEYAKTGVLFLQQDFLNVKKSSDFLDNLENEALEFFDEYINN